MKKQLVAIGLVISCLGSFAQTLTKGGVNNQISSTNVQRCSTTQVMEALRAQDPVAYDLHQQQQEQILQDWIMNNYASWQAQRAVITIPVVVQIWENTSTVPDVRVTEQLQTLNEDFRRTNSDTVNTPAVFASVAADCEIEFCLASQDENGSPTTGIVRHTAGGQPNGNNELWDPTQYLNLYVYNLGGGLLGYTYLASQAPNNAVHIGSSYFGNTSSAPYNMGRTATHEVGHWLNLEHIWGDATCGNDQVSDTPPQQSDNGGCPSHPYNLGACTGNTTGEMFMNYMDYTNDACMNTFTAGQKARMISAINNYRYGLLTSQGCAGSQTLQANFSANQTTIVVGNSVNFTDLSTGGATTWDWTFTGAATTTSTAQNPSGIAYNNVGCYEVQLDVTDGSTGSDNETKTCYIDVIAQATGCDTLNYPLPGTQVLYGSGGWGYISGDNDYGDVAKANFYDNYSPYTEVNGMYINFAKAHSASGSSTINMVMWADNGGSPGSVLASETINIGSITTNAYSYYQFSSPVTISGNFYLGIELSGQAGDTVAVYTNDDGETNPGTAWEQWSDFSWHNYSENPDSWGMNMEHALHPVVCAGGGGTTLSASTSSSNATCGNANGSATATPSGGTGSYTYSWSNGGSTATINGLTAGNYTVTVSDGTDTVIESVTVGSTTTSMTATSSSTDEDCGQSNGGASVTVSGQTGSVTYAWSNGGSSSSITGVSAGSYSVTMTDGTGCSIIESVQVGSAGGFNATISGTNVACAGNANGTATLTPSGATGSVTYVWSNGGSTATINGLSGGTYYVTATDGAGCVYSSSINITEPASALSTSSSSTDATCTTGGSANVVATGGTAPYSYLWSNGSMNDSQSGLAVGTYDCTITDANGCSSQESVAIASNAVPIVISTSSTNEACGQNDGTATATATGGTGGLSYAWSDGQTTSIAINLGSGYYGVTVTDGSGCSETETVVVNNNSGFSVSVSTTDLSCNGNDDGIAIATATGGTSPYTYSWSSGASTSAVNGLSGGAVSLTATDNGGCTFVVNESIYEPSSINIAGNATNATSNGGNDGSITTVATGGTGSFTYSWSNGSTGASINGLSAGNYTVTALDANGCSESETFTVGEPLGIVQISNEFNIVLYPNPTTGLLNINIESSVSEMVNISVVNTMGQIVISDQQSVVNGKTTFAIDLSNQSNGMYFINLTGEEINSTQRVILK